MQALTFEQSGLTMLQVACAERNQPAIKLLMQHPKIKMLDSLTYVSAPLLPRLLPSIDLTPSAGF